VKPRNSSKYFDIRITPHRKDTVPPFQKIPIVISKNYMRHSSTMCGQNAETCNVEEGGIYRVSQMER
jgi:hypothetical protein